jgi:hypothetical protein
MPSSRSTSRPSVASVPNNAATIVNARNNVGINANSE